MSSAVLQSDRSSAVVFEIWIGLAVLAYRDRHIFTRFNTVDATLIRRLSINHKPVNTDKL